MILPSAAAMSACAMTIAASTSTIRRFASSRSASCLVLSSLKIGAPFSILSRHLTKISLTRPFVSGRIATVRNSGAALVVEGW